MIRVNEEKIKLLRREALENKKLKGKVDDLMKDPSRRVIIENKSMSYEITELKATLSFLRRELKNREKDNENLRRQLIDAKVLLTYKEDSKLKFSISSQFETMILSQNI